MSVISRGGLLLSMALLSCVTVEAQEPRIEITDVPPYLSFEPLRGRVIDAAPAAHHVATYLFLEGLGWWVKPTFNSCTPIAANGQFTVDVTTGGVDNQAHRYAVFLLPSSELCPNVGGAAYLPDSLLGRPSNYAERTPYMLQFAGYKWIRRHSLYLGGPESNCFHEDDALVDAQSQLRLSLAPVPPWSLCGGEVTLDHSLGCGEYQIHTVGRVDTLDPTTVFGMFTWDPDARPAFREMDIELGRWCNPADPNNAQFVVQPYGLPGHLVRFPVALSDDATPLTFRMKWTPGVVTMSVYRGHHFGPPLCADPVFEHTFTEGVPTAGAERFRLNLWRFCSAGSGCDCSSNLGQEVLVTHFSHVPPQRIVPTRPCRPSLTGGE